MFKILGGMIAAASLLAIVAFAWASSPGGAPALFTSSPPAKGLFGPAVQDEADPQPTMGLSRQIVYADQAAVHATGGGTVTAIQIDKKGATPAWSVTVRNGQAVWDVKVAESSDAVLSKSLVSLS